MAAVDVRVAVRAWEALGRAGSALLALAVPVECPGCGEPDVRVCGGCSAPLRAAEPVPVRVAVPVPVWACARYAGPVARCVVAWKDRGRHDLRAPLADALARAVTAAIEPAPRCATLLLVPVPSSPAAARARGADVGRDLAGAAARRLRRSGVAARVRPVLRQGRRVEDQAGLGAAARRSNLAGALAVRGLRRGDLRTPVVVVDDVVTTGASAAEACAVLARHGVRVAAVAAACWTPRRSPGGVAGGPGRPHGPGRTDPADDGDLH